MWHRQYGVPIPLRFSGARVSGHVRRKALSGQVSGSTRRQWAIFWLVAGILVILLSAPKAMDRASQTASSAASAPLVTLTGPTAAEWAAHPALNPQTLPSAHKRRARSGGTVYMLDPDCCSGLHQR